MTKKNGNRKPYITAMLLVVVSLLASACRASTPTPVAQTTLPPTTAPTQAPPIEAPTTAPQPTEVMPAESATSPATSSTFGEAWQSVDCASIDVAPTVAAIADCGYVTVPANRAAGDDRTIQLAVARVHSPSASPGAPIFLATGGPGGYGFGSIQAGHDTNWPQGNAAVLADHDWVFFTQRGTPGANPELSCLAFDFLPLDASKNGWAEDQVVAETTTRIQACYDEFVQQGVNFADFNSVENAEDVDAIRQTLGYDKIIFYGESYGTQLGQYVMRQHPEILQAVVLDGVVPVEFTTFAQTTNTTDGFKRALDACRADPDCDKIYPNLESVLGQAYDALNANPASVQMQLGNQSVTLHVNGLNMLDALFLNIYGGGADVPYLIYGAKDNDPAALTALAPSYNPLNRRAIMMNFAVNCSDDPSTSPDEFAEEGVLPMYTAYTLDFARRYMLASCPIMNVPRLPDSSDVPVTEDIPTLVLNGALDPATSASNGDLVASHLPNVKEVTFGNGGHIQLSKPCAQQIIAAFLKDPSAQLDTSCVPASQTFKLPFAGTGTSPDGNVSLTVTLPPDFIQGDPSAAQWQKAAGTPIFAINVDPAGTTALEALQKGLAKLGISPSEADIKDGPEIAGLPSKHYQGTTNLGDKEYALDAFGIENENGAYVILALEGNPALLDYWRTQTLPAILESATVQPASSSSASATASGDGAASQPGATSMTSDGDIQSHAFTVGSTIRYQVAAGDWLVQIARCFGTSYQKVLRANPQISDPGQLRRGMMVSVPDLGSTGPVYGPPCVVFHRVMADDTWNSIASSYNADLHLLKEANPGRLSLRRTLVVPNNSAGATS